MPAPASLDGSSQARPTRASWSCRIRVLGHGLSGGRGVAAEGEASEAWKFMDALHENIGGAYTHSGSAPCVQARAASAWRVSRSTCAALRKRPRARRSDIIPAGRAPAGKWKRGVSSRAPRTSRSPRRSPTGSATKAANELYSKTYAIVGLPGVENYPPNYPKTAERLHGQERPRLDGREPRDASSPSGPSVTSPRPRRRTEPVSRLRSAGRVRPPIGLASTVPL